MKEEKRYVGTPEDRINKWMRMCLHWQFDIRRNQERNATYYFTKYHVGKYPKSFFEDIRDNIIDRDYVINKMNQISEYRMRRDRNIGLKSNRVKLHQEESANSRICLSVGNGGVKVNDDTIVKMVGKSLYDLSGVSTQRLMNELASRQ